MPRHAPVSQILMCGIALMVLVPLCGQQIRDIFRYPRQR